MAVNESSIQELILIDFTSEDTKQLFTFVTGEVIQPPLFLLGLVANLVNIIVYLQLRLKDSITICFFVLSCTDLICILLCIMANACSSFSYYLREVWNTDSPILTFLILCYYGPFYDISQGITTFIAVQKCWCVALPLRFKNTFTTKRTVLIILTISLTIFTLHMPILTTQGLVGMFDPVNNRTEVKFWISEISGKLYYVVGLISLLFTNTCQMTVVFCLIVLASKLRASSKFRRSTKMADNERLPSELNAPKTQFSNQHLKKETKAGKISFDKQSIYVHEKRTRKKMSDKYLKSQEDTTCVPRPAKMNSKKELMAIKSTTFVSILFVTFNTFKLIHYYAILIFPEYSIVGRHKNTYWVSNEMRYTLEILHCSCNMFVYFKFNSRYRSTLLASCLRKR